MALRTGETVAATKEIGVEIPAWFGRGLRPAALLGVLALGIGTGLSPAAHLARATTPGSEPAGLEVGPTSQALQAAPAASVPSPAATEAFPTAVSGAPTSPAPPTSATGRSAPVATRATSNAYVHYYLWWSTKHWHDTLGTAYPYGANPLPQPGFTDATGCNPKLSYPGATIVDLPSEGLYNQDLASTYDLHIATAAAAGVRGFVVSWMGDGTSNQTASSASYSSRLALLTSRVHAYNTAHASPFGLALGMSPYGNYSRASSAIINDLNYFAQSYGADSAFRNAFSSKPLVMLLDSRKFSPGTLAAVSGAVRARLFLLGDETASSWPKNGPFLDGTSYYWSSENPSKYTRASLVSLGDKVHAAGKLWFSPFTAGFGNQLRGGTCVPRNGVATLDATWAGNSASHPDAWMGISWNEFVENTYLQPTRAYGTTYLDELQRLITAG
jgi:hypothetical protein